MVQIGNYLLNLTVIQLVTPWKSQIDPKVALRSSAGHMFYFLVHCEDHVSHVKLFPGKGHHEVFQDRSPDGLYKGEDETCKHLHQGQGGGCQQEMGDAL